MPTSGITIDSRTARDFVIEALRENAIIPLGETPDADELFTAITRLNNMIKAWSSKGVLWKQETIVVAGAANAPAITLPAYVRNVTGCRYIVSGVNQRPMARWERDEYFIMPNKLATGTSSVYYVDRTTAGVILYVWQVPNVPFELSLDIDRSMDIITDPGQTVDIPDEFNEAVMTNLALRCCDMFGKEPTALLLARAQASETEMFDAWRPASYYMGPF